MNDDYPTCAETYVTLRLYHDSADPALVTAALDLAPSETQCVGDSYERRGVALACPLSGWFLCSEGQVRSYDAATHLDWLLLLLHPRKDTLEALRAQGWRMDISCMWDSHAGHGGPTLGPELLRRLAYLGIALWFDIYFHGAYDAIESSKRANATQPNV